MKTYRNGPRVFARVLALALGLAVIFLCARALPGCATVKRAVARERVVEAIKTAYENGGRAAVSNRIERLVSDGTLSAKQGAKIHRIMQMAYDGLIGNVAAKIEDAACEDDPACPPCGADTNCPPCGERNEDADCGSCDDCKAKL
jgi:hypothetical protein